MLLEPALSLSKGQGMSAITASEEAKSHKESEQFFKTSIGEQDRLFPVPECTRISIREAVDVLLEEAHELADRADAKRDTYLRGAVDRAIQQVHKVADVLESLEYQLTNERRMH
jgi:hypothetical protein